MRLSEGKSSSRDGKGGGWWLLLANKSGHPKPYLDFEDGSCVKMNLTTICLSIAALQMSEKTEVGRWLPTRGVSCCKATNNEICQRQLLLTLFPRLHSTYSLVLYSTYGS